MKIQTNKVTIKYSDKVRGYAEEILRITLDQQSSEFKIREKIQQIIDDNDIDNDIDVMYDGNSVWSLKKVQEEVENIKKNGVQSMGKYLYEFMHLCAGTIAHYNRDGWIAVYPTIEDIRNRVIRGSSGDRVLREQPHWKADTIKIAKWLIEEF